MNLINPRRSELSKIPYLNNALDFITSKIGSLWGVEHDENGTHTDITADSITVSGDVTVEGSVGDIDAESVSFGDNAISHEAAAGTDTVSVDGHWLPLSDDTYDLGKGATSPIRRWRNLFVSDGVFTRGRTLAEGDWQSFTPMAYGATDGATWTVGGGDFVAATYRLDGTTLMVNFAVGTTSITVATPARLQIPIPVGSSIVGNYYASCAYLSNGTAGSGVIEAAHGTAVISFLQDLAGTAWPLSANLTTLAGQIAFEVSGA